METVESSKISKKQRARQKSRTRFPNKSYVVAFSLKETYDDLVTAQQMICNKRSPQERSPQESTNSITPTNSLKLFETEQTDKLDQIVDTPETETNSVDIKFSPFNSIYSVESMTPTNSIKFLSSEDNSSASLKTMIGERENMVIDLSEKVRENDIADDINDSTVKVEIDTNEYKGADELKQVRENNEEICCVELTNESPETEKSLVAENRSGDLKRNSENEKWIIEVEPKAIFRARNSRILKKRRTSKRIPKKTINMKHSNFKYKNPKKVINNQLERYYEKRNSINANQIQKELYSDEISTVVSRSRVLHKITAKENLLDELEFITFINDVGLNEYENESLTSSRSTAKKFIVSDSSHTTLTQKSSKTSKTVIETDNKPTKSVIKKSTENIPYKTDVINVAVAVAYKRSKVEYKEETIHVPSKERVRNFDSLTSSEMVSTYVSNLTSNSATNSDDFKAVTIESSDGTLVNKNSSFDVSSDDFVIARTSSDFKRSSDESTDTLKDNVKTVVDIETARYDYTDKYIDEDNPKLLETVINLGMYSEMMPSTSSDTPYEYDCNDVIITNNIKDKYQINSDKGDNKLQEAKNILKKTIEKPIEKKINKTVNLPNQAKIKALLKNSDLPQMKCAEESRHPTYMPEMWDRLVMTLELAVKKLEENLVDKIVKELKKSLFSYSLPKDIPLSESKLDKVDKIELEKERDAQSGDQGLQCDLVKNTIIDKIMQKLSFDGPKIIEPSIPVKTLHKTDMYNDIEFLKAPEASQLIAEGGDTITVSTITFDTCKFRRLKMLFRAPVNFVRENVLVITSVPTFFVVLLCVYCLILIILKPW